MKMGATGENILKTGLGLRAEHMGEFLTERPKEVSWLEVHTENYLCAGGPRLASIESIRENYKLSLHGVALSLGSCDLVDRAQLGLRHSLIERLQPDFVSEHVSWSTFAGTYYNDLLPLPYTEEALSHLCDNIDLCQTKFRRSILLENPSNYLELSDSKIPESEFIANVAVKTGCRLLLDINNVHVSALNTGIDPKKWINDLLERVPVNVIGEIHLAGHSVVEKTSRSIVIDNHGAKICEAVWDLLRFVAAKIELPPVLIEWDTNIPDLSILFEEVKTANAIVAHSRRTRAKSPS